MGEYLDSYRELSADPEGFCEYVVCDPIPADLATRIVSQLPADRELSFHDPLYPSSSDPGAYIDVRQNSGQYVYAFGNHGWHRGWERQSKEFLAHYLGLCLAAQRSARGSARFSVRPIEPVEIRRLIKHEPA